MRKKIILIFIVIFVIIFLLFFYLKTKKNEPKVIEEPTIAINQTDENLKEISFNNIRINDKLKSKMKNLVLDASFSYIYDDVQINADKNDNITYLGVSSHYSIDDNGNKINEFFATKDAKIEYKNKRLKTISDFKEIFGEGTVDIKNNDDYFIIYKGESLELDLYIVEGQIYNIELKIINVK